MICLAWALGWVNFRDIEVLDNGLWVNVLHCCHYYGWYPFYRFSLISCPLLVATASV
jgi:hypothetical protein